ncbi:MAG: hypothetical protein A2X49_00260 [Lentisphaerae bacterium GWF2_52_8]|nr:MAG: hypothetical protein A2X49_00260 [Lentisphaerae bacterium GWF2_52_8]
MTCKIVLKGLQDFKDNGASVLFPQKTLHLHAMLLNAGHSTQSSFSYDWHGLKRGSSEFAIWQYTLSGQGRLDYAGNTYELNPGQAFLVHVPHEHRYYYPHGGTEPWEFMYVSLYGKELLRLWLDIERRAGPVISFSPESKTLKTALRILQLAIKQELNTPFTASALAYEMLMSVLEDGLQNIPGESKEPEFIKRVLRYCLNHLDSELDVDELAAIAGYSRCHFSRIFTKSYGMPPANFVRELRLRQAIRLLQSEHLSIKEIAARCGFLDASHFSKAFKSETGKSPRAFRSGSPGEEE